MNFKSCSHIEWIDNTGLGRECMMLEKAEVTYALLKHPPKAPSNAAVNGVRCVGFEFVIEV